MIRGHLRPIPKARPLGLYVLVLSRGVFFCDRPHLTPSDNKLFAVKSRNLRHETQNSEWEIRLVCPIRSSLISHHISRLLTTNWLQPLMERKKLRLRPRRGSPRPLNYSSLHSTTITYPWPPIVILSGAQRSRRISLKSLPLVAASRDHSNYPRTTLRYSCSLRPKVVVINIAPDIATPPKCSDAK